MTLRLIILFLLLLAISLQFIFTRPIILPSEPYQGIARFVWLDSVNLYLREGKILMFPRNTIIQDVREVRSKEEGYPFIVHLKDQRLEDVWPNDDQGYPFLISVFGGLLGLNEVGPATFIKFNYLALVIIGLVSAALLFMGFKSLLIAMTFYYLYLRIHIYDGYIDHHWLIGAMVIFYLSFLIFFLRTGAKFKPFLFGLYFLFAGLANIIRSGDGAIGLILVFSVLLSVASQNGFRKYSNKAIIQKHFFWGILLMFIFLLPNFMLDFFRYQRDRIYFNSLPSERLNYHAFWNGAFMGLGYIPNPYGLKWDDDLPIQFASKVNPNVKFHTQEYNKVMRQLYITYSGNHPDLWFGNLIAKTGEIHKLVGDWIWRGSYRLLPPVVSNYLLYVVLVLIFVLSRKDKKLLVIFGLLIAALFTSSVPGLVALPTPFYLKGLLASVFMAFFYLLGLIYIRLRSFR